MNYKDKEKLLCHALHLATGKQVWLAPNEYSPYDAFTENAILEFKIRKDYYEQKMLQKEKFEKNLKEGKKQNKAFLYVVWDSKGIWVLDVTRHQEEIKAAGLTTIPQPKYTAFNKPDKDEKVDVEFYLFPMNLMHKIADAV